MLTPARHPSRLRPARKYSERSRDARRREAKPEATLYVTKASTMARSIIRSPRRTGAPADDGPGHAVDDERCRDEARHGPAVAAPSPPTPTTAEVDLRHRLRPEAAL